MHVLYTFSGPKKYLKYDFGDQLYAALCIRRWDEMHKRNSSTSAFRGYWTFTPADIIKDTTFDVREKNVFQLCTKN